ncbi:hypothetical protein LTR28_006324 [Elasticomyces elasticus]|nr:hypothetical protein LTR28_006324 [Elasticomyces elasticus]
MPSWLPSIPYSPAGEGYWSPVTSTLNWCEEDYYATVYAAEIVNTLTNLLFQFLAFKGIFNCLRHGHDTIFLVTFVGYFLVGTGSFLFHATLKCAYAYSGSSPVPCLLLLLRTREADRLRFARSHAACR